MAHFDLLVIGSGKGGKTLATQMANRGQNVALVEKKWIGGSCINVACIPTKTLVKTAKVAHTLQNLAHYGIVPKPPAYPSPLPLEMHPIFDRKRVVVETMIDRNQQAFDSAGVHLLAGSASFLSNNEVCVDDAKTQTVHSADRIVINTGARPSIPDIPGLLNSNPLTNESLLDLNQIPEHLLILGAGYIGCEFAQAFRRLGAQVTLVDRNTRLLPKEDPEISQAIHELLESEGIQIILGAKTKEVSGLSSDAVSLHLEAPLSSTTIRGSHLLVALGRLPNTEDLKLQAANVRVRERGGIEVNHQLQTHNPNIWAVGDVTGGPQFTHVSWDDYRILLANLQGGNRTTENRLIPYTLFTDPELGRIGVTEDQARQQGRNIRIARLAAKSIPRAVTSGETHGVLKAVIDAETDEILGASILCTQAGEILATIQVAMLCKMKTATLRDVIFSHPTMAEAINDWFYKLSV